MGRSGGARARHFAKVGPEGKMMAIAKTGGHFWNLLVGLEQILGQINNFLRRIGILNELAAF